MLYYVVPPIIIVISFSFLIFYIFKRADVSVGVKLPQQEAAHYYKNKVGRVFSVLGNFFLRVLEKATQRVRIFSLKFHNLSDDALKAIKKKKQQSNLSAQVFEENNFSQDCGVEIREDVADAASEIEREDKVQIFSEESETRFVRKRKPLEDRTVQSRQRVSMPRKPKVEEVPAPSKDGMENALIRRIAINPRDIEAYERLGDYYFETKNFADSLECYRQVVKLSPIHYKARVKIRKIEKMLG